MVGCMARDEMPAFAPRGTICNAVIDHLQAAADALNRGDPEPFAALFAEDAEWRGLTHGHLWWKRTPS